MLQKVIFWTQENEEQEEAELPMELLQVHILEQVSLLLLEGCISRNR